jgi:hypothetical protein
MNPHAGSNLRNLEMIRESFANSGSTDLLIPVLKEQSVCK